MSSKRRLEDGREVAVHTNHGLRKVCGCPRRSWAKCPHSYHFSFKWGDRHYRFSLDRYAGRRIDSRTDAENLADGIRKEIRQNTLVMPGGAPAATLPVTSTGQAARTEPVTTG